MLLYALDRGAALSLADPLTLWHHQSQLEQLETAMSWSEPGNVVEAESVCGHVGSMVDSQPTRPQGFRASCSA